MSVANGWEIFYTIVGSSAGALIGLQFVVLTLVAARPIRDGIAEAGGAFATPSVVHFTVVLLLSAIVTAPWDQVVLAAILWGLVGLGGVVYVVVVVRRMRTQSVYRPVLEDWLFHVIFPLAAYAVLAVSAVAAFSDASLALFLVGGAVLVLLLVGIHNAWDAVLYHLSVRPRQEG